ncbi:MAG: nitroreductase family protein [Lachnospiraceae bacterium]|nr:nitroreductase family protein [Lachnospiraceae bacterium]
MISEKEAMIQRHSVRNYLDKKIEEDKIALIQEKIGELNKEGSLNIHFSEDAGKTFRSFLSRMSGLGSAPSAIICSGADSDDLEQRVGYYGEKLVLYIQQLGLNTCWVGMFSRKQAEKLMPAENGERTVIAIAVGYGETQGKARKTKSFEDVTEVFGDADGAKGAEQAPDWFREGVEAALLAPTAMNQQKFTICLNKDGSVELIDNGGVFSRVDLGIVKYHFELGSGHKAL